MPIWETRTRHWLIHSLARTFLKIRIIIYKKEARVISDQEEVIWIRPLNLIERAVSRLEVKLRLRSINLRGKLSANPLKRINIRKLLLCQIQGYSFMVTRTINYTMKMVWSHRQWLIPKSKLQDRQNLLIRLAKLYNRFKIGERESFQKQWLNLEVKM